jgi:hypothetical protein
MLANADAGLVFPLHATPSGTSRMKARLTTAGLAVNCLASLQSIAREIATLNELRAAESVQDSSQFVSIFPKTLTDRFTRIFVLVL